MGEILFRRGFQYFYSAASQPTTIVKVVPLTTTKNTNAKITATIHFSHARGCPTAVVMDARQM